MLELHFIIVFNREVTDNLQKKINIDLFTKSLLLFFAVCLVCQMKRNLDKSTVENQIKLCTANEQRGNIDFANRN